MPHVCNEFGRILALRGAVLAEGQAFGEGDVEGGGDGADVGEAGGAEAGGLVALDPLFGDADFVGEAALAPAACDAGLDEQGGSAASSANTAWS